MTIGKADAARRDRFTRTERQTNVGRSDDADDVSPADLDREIEIGAAACALSESPGEA